MIGEMRSLVILGMHRSGTSALAGLVQLLGVNLGEDLLPAMPEVNEKGFFEHQEILDIHEDLLKSLGSSWYDPLPLDDNWWQRPDVLTQRRRLVTVLRRDFANSRLWGVKDPRLCRLFPLWKSILAEVRCEPLCVIVTRNPHEVADSLAKRDGFSLTLGYLLWLDHMLSAERFTRGLPRAFVNYGSLLADWRSVISEVTGKLDLEWPLSFQQVESEVDEFLSDRLRHQLSTDKRLESDPDLSRWVLGTYRELAAAASGESASMHRRLSLTYREFKQAQRLYGPELLRIRSDLASSGRELAIRTQQLDAMESSLAARNTELEDAHAGRAVVEDDLATAHHHLEANSRQLALHQSSNTDLEAELEQKNVKLAASRETIHTLEVDLASSGRELAIRTQQLDAMESSLAARNTELEDAHAGRAVVEDDLATAHHHLEANSRQLALHQSSNTDLEAELEQKNVKLAASRETIHTLEVDLDERNQRIDSFLRSLSWRITSPLRGIKRWLLAPFRLAAHVLRERIVNRKLGKAIANSGLFDERFYLTQYPDVRLSGIPPLEHFLRYGALDGRDPSPHFSTSQYLTQNSDVAESGLNPLVHYLRHGVAEGREPAALLRDDLRPDFGRHPIWRRFSLAIRHPSEAARLIRRTLAVAKVQGLRGISARVTSELAFTTAPLGKEVDTASVRKIGSTEVDQSDAVIRSLESCAPITIIVPIYNAYDELVTCLESLVLNTTAPANLLLIDDASPDERIPALLWQYAELNNIRMLRNQTNLGFVGTVNRGIREADGDVILLNSDTQVPPRWLAKLAVAAYSDTATATVTAISNSAGAFSVPNAGETNPVPSSLPIDEISRAISHENSGTHVPTPTGNGFCMYIKRAAIAQVGRLDEGKFPRGYGEENDWCMRASRLGWRHIVDGSTFVLHRGTASFTESEKNLLGTAALETIEKLYPEYGTLVASFINSPELKAVQAGVRKAYAQLESKPQFASKMRVLQVMIDTTGGARQATLDQLKSLEEKYDSFLLLSTTTDLKLYQQKNGELAPIAEWPLKSRWKVTEFSRQDYRAIFYQILVEFDIELIQIQHFLGFTFDLPAIARALHIPVIVSIHDFYLVCPTIHLMDDQKQFCGGTCTEGLGQCWLSLAWHDGLPVLKEGYIDEWRHRVGEALKHIDLLVAPSSSAKRILQNTYPFLLDTPTEVVEHGMSLDERDARVEAPQANEKVRILIPGNIDIHKGSRFIQELMRLDRGERIDFHLLGLNGDPELKGYVDHGSYDLTEFPERVKAIAPHFAGIFSVCSETYCFTLSEAWAVGLPALVTDVGAPADRVRAHGGGWVLSLEPTQAYVEILEIASDKERYRLEQEQANLTGVLTTVQAAQEYDSLYKRALSQKVAFGVRS